MLNKENVVDIVKAVSWFLSSVVISFAGILLTNQYNTSQIEISRNKELAALIPKLYDKHADTRLQAIVSLSLYGRNAVHPLVSIWSYSNDEKTCLEVSNSIINIGPDAIPELLEVYGNNNETSQKREWSLHALIRLRYDKSEQLINEALYGKSLDTNIMRSAILGAGYLKLKKTAPRLIQLCKKYRDRDEYYEIVSFIAYALGQMGDEKAKEEIITLLGSPNAKIRIQAVRSMEILGNDKDLLLLNRIASTDPDIEIRGMARHAVKTIEMRSEL